QKGGVWSNWSPAPVIVKLKDPTVPPTIKSSGLSSWVLPALDGSTSVQLEVPDSFATYNWQKSGSPTTLSTSNLLKVSTPASYIVSVKENFGCSNVNSAPFTVVNAN